MPFQVTYSTRHRQFKQVQLVTAGEDQLHICTPTIYLEGIVNGDILGHTVEWEQISGSAETLINGNTLTPYFDSTNNTDVVFRLYIDRNTPYEQFDDVLILRTPTSFPKAAFKSDNSKMNLTLDPLPVDCADIQAFVNVSVPPPTSLHGEEFGSTIEIEVTWAHPGDPVKDLHIEQYRVYENEIHVDSIPDTPISNAGDIQGAGGGPPTETLLYPGTLATYRIDTHYNIGGRKFVRPSCTQDFSTLTIPLVKGYNDAVDGVTFKNNQHAFNKTNYTNIFLPAESNQDFIQPVTFTSNQKVLNATRYVFAGLRDNESAIPVGSFSTDNQTINITRYGGSGIGG